MQISWGSFVSVGLGVMLFFVACGEKPMMTAPSRLSSETVDNSWVGEFFVIPGEQIEYSVTMIREPFLPQPRDSVEVPKVRERTYTVMGKLTTAGLRRAAQGRTSLVLVLNGEARKIGEVPSILANGGNFQAEFRWKFGVNTYRLLVVRDFEENATIREDQVVGGPSPVTVVAPFAAVPPTRLFVRLLWDRGVQRPNDEGKKCDLDLHVWDPQSRHCYYQYPGAVPNGILDIDNTWGFGPETFTLMRAVEGSYTVRVRYFAGSQNVNARVRVSIDEGPMIEYGPHTFDSTMANQDDPTNDWEVVSIPMTAGEVELTYNAETYSASVNSFFPGGPYFVYGAFTLTTAQQVEVSELRNVLREPHGGWWIRGDGHFVDGLSAPDGKPMLRPGTYRFGVDGPASWADGKASGVLRYNEAPGGSVGSTVGFEKPTGE